MDAGLAGFFQNKPDFPNEEWYELCDSLATHDKEHTNPNDVDFHVYKYESEGDRRGIYSSSGYGDGEYPVYISQKDDSIIGVKIVFI